ncbi:hypothetical protein EAX61_07665 [Dokdonia sinensis]|uniref:histidine kinase n=1 Tax=Dokdonia sinensis TaxID=2479847 RepID=A0A3M0G3Q5_9FLAO|nr:sensor histidine kinase [Dokdonia sinensis]RMB59455.1 hypothetical protein EAX61_07665 [Dokdonia sinensis]
MTAFSPKNFKQLLGLFFFLPLLLAAQEDIHLDNTTALVEIGAKTQFSEDVTGELTIEEIASDVYEPQFQAYTQDAINFAGTASAYWLKFDITKEIPGDFYLNVGSAYIDAVGLYEFDSNDNLISTRLTGDDLPFNSREINVGSYLFKLDYDQGATHTFYLRVKSNQPLFFPLRVGTLDKFMTFNHNLDFLQGIYFGFMLLIFLYNLFLYFSTRERIYLYYIAYVFSITWFMASIFGYFFEYFWPETPFLNQIVVVSSGLTMITATLFTQKFLNTKYASPKMHLGSMIFLVLGVIVCILVILGYRISGLKLAQGGLLFMAIYFMILGIRFKIKGYRPATFYLFAWGALIVGIVFAILESVNVVPVMSYLNAMQIGSALEVLLLSFALGDRINLYKRQKEEAQAIALYESQEREKMIQEQNIILERMVKERTAEVAAKNEKLIDLNREKDMLVNVVAHDLRTPLSHIRMLIQLIDMTSLELTEDQVSYLTEIDNSADRLSQLISRILDIHALETNQIKLKNQLLDASSVVQEVTKSFRLAAENKDIRILTTAQSGNHIIEVDKNYLIQVIENLLSNAIKFSERDKSIHIEVNTREDRTYISIKDQGPGISEADQKKLFGRFQKLSAQPTDGEMSIGLGLSIAKKYVESMDGSIHCESKLGIGTEFIVSFESRGEAYKV